MDILEIEQHEILEEYRETLIEFIKDVCKKNNVNFFEIFKCGISYHYFKIDYKICNVVNIITVFRRYHYKLIKILLKLILKSIIAAENLFQFYEANFHIQQFSVETCS